MSEAPASNKLYVTFDRNNVARVYFDAEHTRELPVTDVKIGVAKSGAGLTIATPYFEVDRLQQPAPPPKYKIGSGLTER